MDDGRGVMAMLGSEVIEGVAMLGFDGVGASPTSRGAVRDMVMRVDGVFVSIEDGREEARIVAVREDV